jgi:lipopolysaccharide export system protein LptA
VFLAQRTQPAKTGTADGRAVQASGTVSSAHNSAKPDGPAQVRVSSGTATYFNATRTAQFDGGVRLVTDEATMQGQHAELLLAPSTSAGKAGTGATPPYAGAVTRAKTAGNASGMTFGAVERAVITGAVQVQQPDRKATGERLVYTAADGLFVMTGTPGHWPSVTDAAQGTTTGESIRFRTGDRSVTVLGSGNRRTHVESHLENQRR